jgi:chemotaxis protein histidine kinase CheA
MTTEGRLHARLLETFGQESVERLRDLERGLLALESNPQRSDRQEIVEALFRDAHSLKGAAQVLGLSRPATIAHELESTLHGLRSEVLDSGSLQGLFDALSALSEAIREPPDLVSGSQPTPAASTRSSQAAGGKGLEAVGRRAAAERSAPAGLRPTRRRRAPADEGHAATDSSQEGLWAVAPARSPSASGASEKHHPSGHESAPTKPQPRTGVRVATERLDGLLARIASVIAARDRVQARSAEVDGLVAMVEAWGRDWREAQPEFHRLAATDAGEPLSSLVRFVLRTGEQMDQLARGLQQFSRQIRQDQRRLTSLADDLGSDLLSLRLVPVGSLFEQFRRMVRDIAAAGGKRAELREAGWQTELDREVLERLKDPVMHLLRNALDHGIEPEADRQAAGKPPVGTITLEARQQGGGVLIEVSDDGRGIDAALVRAAALRAGLPEADLPEMTDTRAITPLLLRSGLSTSPSVTEVSGRGVGLDIVRDAVEQLGGSIGISSLPGRGTSVALQVPLTLLVAHLLVIRVGERTVAIPVAAVEHCRVLRDEDLTEFGGRPALRLGDATVPLSSLHDVLGAQSRAAASTADQVVVVLRTTDGLAAFIADGVVEERRTIVKGLGPLVRASASPMVAAAAMVGDDGLLLVLDPAALATTPVRATSERSMAGPEERPDLRLSVLVVDDSITTRTLERGILEAAGFAVTLAEDGVRGLEAVGRGGIDVVVADVDMPRMDGLEMTRRMRAVPETRDVPIILVSGLETPEQREAGLQAGADAYIPKSRFEQQQLIETIARLVG